MHNRCHPKNLSRGNELSQLNDILFRSANVPAHVEGGWALPGGGRTANQDAAAMVAYRIALMIGPKAPLTSENAPIQLPARKTRRRAV